MGLSSRKSEPTQSSSHDLWRLNQCLHICHWSISCSFWIC